MTDEAAVWWLALDLDWTSYEEVKTRRAIVQGWPQLGDLRPLAPTAPRSSPERGQKTEEPR